MIADLESKVLLVTEETIGTYVSENGDFMIWQMVDDRFYLLPTALCGTSKDLDVGPTLLILIGGYSRWICGYAQYEEDSSRSVIKGFQIERCRTKRVLFQDLPKAQMHIQQSCTLQTITPKRNT
jgi:hypothetical protein